jgi:hypothetical protein
MSIVTGLFFLVILLNQQWSPPLRLQASHCSTFRIMCDVPSTAVFCSKSIESLPGIASKFYIMVIIIIIIISCTSCAEKHADTILPVIMCAFTHSLFHVLNFKFPTCRRNFGKAARTANKAERDCHTRHAILSFNHTDSQWIPLYTVNRFKKAQQTASNAPGNYRERWQNTTKGWQD